MESLALQEVSWMATEPLADDVQLMRRIARGDRQALSELYALYQRPLFAYLLQLTPDYGLAEELLQDTLVAVWKSAHSFEGRSKVFLPLDLGVYPDLSAREFLDYVGILKGMDERRVCQQRVEELLEVVSLADVAHRKLKTFSGGMKRRVGIAQALLNDPQLLIVDEPTAGLDPEEKNLLLCFKRENEEMFAR